MIKKELNSLLTAMVFFTRIPSPIKLEYNSQILGLSRKYFPLIGILVATLSLGVYLTAVKILPSNVSIVLMLAFQIFLTGAFHEDGLIDVFDAFGGGYGKDQILTIMKDSRIGAYAAVGFSLTLLLKYTLLLELASKSIGFFVSGVLLGHSLSRFSASGAAQYYKYVRDIDQSKAKPIADLTLSKPVYILSALPCFISLLWIEPSIFISLIFLTLIVMVLLMAYFKKHIGGYTGDCLGAIQQITEVVIYIGMLGLWKFI